MSRPLTEDSVARRRLAMALAASLVLHAAALGGTALWHWDSGAVSVRAEPLQAHLVTPTRPAETVAERILKDTLAQDSESAVADPPTPRETTKAPRAKIVAAAQRQAVQRRLSEHLYYPPEAVAQGLEGDVRLLLTLDGEGRIVDAQVAAGSGHAILDAAALRAVRTMGRLPGLGVSEMILPVVFRLQ